MRHELGVAQRVLWVWAGGSACLGVLAFGGTAPIWQCTLMWNTKIAQTGRANAIKPASLPPRVPVPPHPLSLPPLPLRKLAAKFDVLPA